ncbi:MAG: DUF362 domain-containing protein [Chloroflexi bacterium]|nr:DUF362 domain-containing protein [Chloroflexota bacterium]
MTKTNGHNNSLYPRGVSRRDFLKIAAATGLLAGCSPIRQPDITPTSVPTVTSAPTNTPMPELNVSKVVHARHASVWDDDILVPEAIRQMLDSSITTLTGLNDPGKAWATLFDPGERIAIKVNTINSSNFWTHTPLVMAVAECLQGIGIPDEQIIIFDRSTGELRSAGFPVNQNGPGVRCYGTDGNYTAGWTLLDTNIVLSDILLNCDALINIPILKGHSLAGCTFAMKNHYGTIDNAPRFHRPIGPAIAGLNALQPIRDRTRLIIGDMLTICTQDWRIAVTGDSILMSVDPVAHDTVGLQELVDVITSQGKSVTGTMNTATWWLEQGAELGLGIHNLDNIELVKVAAG